MSLRPSTSPAIMAAIVAMMNTDVHVPPARNASPVPPFRFSKHKKQKRRKEKHK